MAPYRAGVIPLIVINGETYYCYGVDVTYKTLIDLCGHIEPSDTSYAHTAYREFTEETLGVFVDLIDEISVVRSPFVYDSDTLDYLVILPSSTDINDIRQRFLDRLALEPTDKVEIIDLVWLPYSDLVTLTDQEMYFRSRRLIGAFPR